MKNSINLQEMFLNIARKEKITVTIFLTNGFQFNGIITGFDNYCVMLNNNEKLNIVYKHAISTIVPSKEINFMEHFEEYEK